MIKRNPDGRSSTDLRPITIETGVNRYAEGSVLIKCGNTQVLCTATVEESVPAWLKGQGQGWITAEYSMLPRATHTRTRREREKVSGRTHEIQRLIGRALRTMVDMKKLGERSILVDCDVIQADGGTRCASITGACVAVGIALSKLIEDGKISENAWINSVSAISLGMKDDQVLVDLDYDEDSSCDVDSNYVITGDGKLVEFQGTAEKKAFSKEDLDEMVSQAFKAAARLKEVQYREFQKLQRAPKQP